MKLPFFNFAIEVSEKCRVEIMLSVMIIIYDLSTNFLYFLINNSSNYYFYMYYLICNVMIKYEFCKHFLYTLYFVTLLYVFRDTQYFMIIALHNMTVIYCLMKTKKK